MTLSISARVRAILLALLVTFLWSTSWVLIKFALEDIPPLTFAGLRYTLAFLVLLPGLWRQRSAVRALSRPAWRQLVVLGLVYYTMTQGGQFVTLNHLEAVTFSLLLNFSSVLVAIFGIFTLHEVPTPLQWAGTAIFIVGVLIYFSAVPIGGEQTLGLLLAMGTVGANAIASVLGRAVNRHRTTPPLVVTGVSMGVGALVLLALGLAVEGLPPLSWRNWLTIAWLAVVNTALAFTLWNRSLQHLSAVESSIINNTMLVQIAILAWLFLGAQLSARDLVGLALAAVGIFLANWWPRPRPVPQPDDL